MSLDNISRLFFPWEENPFRLWSLLDMLKISAEQYILIGQYLDAIGQKLLEKSKADEPLTGKNLSTVKSFLLLLKDECEKLKLSTSSPVLKEYIEKIFSASGANASVVYGEFRILSSVLKNELQSKLFLYVLPDRVHYYQWVETFDEKLTTSFPEASKELLHAGNCFALDEYTACVFHCMRGVEIGLRSLSKYLDISFPDLDLEQWKVIIDKIESEIKSKEQKLPKGRPKTEELTFCSNAALQFRYFKDAFRNHVSHTRSTYDDREAERVMRGTKDFLQALSFKLGE